MVLDILHTSASDYPSGFTQYQFRKLDQLYSIAAASKAINYRAVDCDFDLGIVSYTYYHAESYVPYIQFVIRKISPRTQMFEVYLKGRGRIAKSGIFDRAFENLRSEVESLVTSRH